MSLDEIQVALLDVLKEVQTLGGHSWKRANPNDKPIEDLEGFDSLIAVESTVMMEVRLGCGDLGIDSIFVSEDGRRALTVQQITQNVKNLLVKNGRDK
jgi:hypothetical protein